MAPAVPAVMIAPLLAIILASEAGAVVIKPGWRERYQIYDEFVQQTTAKVSTWQVSPVIDSDRVAVTILQPAHLQKHIDRFAYVIRSNVHRLGSAWALQIFYGEESEKSALSKALGDPVNITWSPIVLQGRRRMSLNHAECSWYRLSLDFWEAVPPRYEHILVFESDSLLLRRDGCVDAYIGAGFDYVGAPWGLAAKWHPPAEGGNGGFSLRSRSAVLKALGLPQAAEMRGPDPLAFKENEDSTLVRLMLRSNATFPSRPAATRFAVETMYKPGELPCGFHKPWTNLGAEVVETLIGGIEID